MFKVTIVEKIEKDGHEIEVERYKQIVDALDLQAVMAAVNRKPRKPRTKKGAVPE